MQVDNLTKYKKAFAETFEIDPDGVTTLEYMSIEQWDSVGHMSLISNLEDTFDIMMDMDDIIDFASYRKGIEILSKYNVEI